MLGLIDPIIFVPEMKMTAYFILKNNSRLRDCNAWLEVADN